MKLRVVFFIGILFFLPLALRAEDVSVSLPEAIAIALRSNPDILLKTEDLKKAKLKIAEANSGLFPVLSLTGSWTDTRGFYSKDLSQATAGATLKQYLYKGGKVINTIRQSQGDFIVTQALLDKEKLEAVLSVKEAFYAFLLAEKFAVLNKSILENTEAHLDFIKERYAGGQASKSEILNIEAALSSVREAYEGSLNQVESSQSLLRNLLFLDEKALIRPRGELVYEAREIAYDDSFIKAMQTRPEIKQYTAQEDADNKAVEIAKADTRPSVYASWDYYSRSHVTSTTTKGWNDYNVVGLTFSWPVFDGWAAKAKVEQAIVDLKETRLTKEKAIKDIALELKNAYLEFKNALAGIDSRKADVVLYKDKQNVAQEKYKAGIISSLDLDDVSLGYGIALFNHQQGVYDYLVAKARFEKATGGY